MIFCYILNFENYKNITYFLPKIFEILLKDENNLKKVGKRNDGNMYHFLFMNQKISTKEKNLIFSVINKNLLHDKEDLIKNLLAQENNEKYPPFITYLLNCEINEQEEKYFKENILEKSIINKKRNYQNVILNLLPRNKIKNFFILFEFLEENKLLDFFFIEKNGACFINEIIIMKINNVKVIEKIVDFIIKNFDLVNFIEKVKYLKKFLIHYLDDIKKQELNKIILLIKEKFIPEIKKEEELFIQKKNKIEKIEYNNKINKTLFLFNSNYKEFYKSISELITKIWFDKEFDLNESKEMLLSLLDLIGVYNYNDAILEICFSNEKFRSEIIDIFIEKYYSKFKLEENDKYLIYFSLFNFQNSFNDNKKLQNKNYIYFYLRFIKGIPDKNMKIYYQNLIFSLLYNYNYESQLPLIFTEQENNIIINSKNLNLFIPPKLLSDEVKLTLLSSLLNYEVYKNFYEQFIRKIFSSLDIFSVIDKLNNTLINENVKRKNENNIEIELFNNNKKEYKNICDLLNKHFILKYYLLFFNSLVKKSKFFKFQNGCIKEIAKSINNEDDLIMIMNQQFNEFIKYYNIMKEKRFNLGFENDEIKNENNIFGLNILYLEFKVMIKSNFDDKSLIIENFSDDIIRYKDSYLKGYNIIENDIFLNSIINTEKAVYNSDNIFENKNQGENISKNIIIDTKNNFNIEKYILQFYNFNSEFFQKLISHSGNNIFKVFKKITEKIKDMKLFEILFNNKKEYLRKFFEKIDFEKIVKCIINENDLVKVNEKMNELKEIKIMKEPNYFNWLIKFYEVII